VFTSFTDTSQNQKNITSLLVTPFCVFTDTISTLLRHCLTAICDLLLLLLLLLLHTLKSAGTTAALRLAHWCLSRSSSSVLLFGAIAAVATIAIAAAAVDYTNCEAVEA
jgi:hypothetical protein